MSQIELLRMVCVYQPTREQFQPNYDPRPCAPWHTLTQKCATCGQEPPMMFNGKRWVYKNNPRKGLKGFK